MKARFKRGLAMAAASALTLTIVQAAGAASSDAAAERIPAWASAEVAEWQQLGLVKGDEHGRIQPDRPVTKTEFVTFVNRVFGFTAKTDKAFVDVPASAWYATEIAKAYAAGEVIGDDSGRISPLEVLTREKAALILSRVFEVAASGGTSSAFADDGQISAWAKDAVYALKDAGYIEGTPEGAFQPKKELTRAEAIKMINNAMGALVADSANHADIAGGNLVVNTAGGTLSGLKLTGNLYVTPGVGEGTLTIANSQIGGTVYVQGGGDHSVVLQDSQVGSIVVEKKDGPVRVVLNGTTTVQGAVEATSDGTVENATSAAIPNLIVSASSGHTVSLSGPIAQLLLNSPAALQIGASNIAKLLVALEAEGGRIALDGAAKVGDFTANGGVEVTGDGLIDEATINAGNVSLAQLPGKLVVNAEHATVAGKTVDKNGDGTGTAGTGSNGSNGSTGGGSVPPVDLSTKLYTYEDVLGSFADAGPQAQVKQYLNFLADPTYKPSVANPDTDMPDLANAQTFVNQSFTVKPSLFAALRGINTSVLAGGFLWIGTDDGVTRINLQDDSMLAYKAADKQLKDDKVLLLIADGASGVYAISATGVAHIQQ